MPRIIAMLIVRNEAHRYLRLCLNDLSQYVTEIVVLDDASTDATPAICGTYAKVHLIRKNTATFWQNESLLRQECWAATIKRRPEWIMAIDADEIFENRLKTSIQRFTKQKNYDQISFQLVEFWGSLTQYRVDKMWNPQNRWGVYLIRYLPGYPYQWPNQPLHCGRLPHNLPGNILQSGLRLKHYGYANQKDHLRKYQAYLQHDPQGIYSPLSHYQSILDPSPVLKTWQETKPKKESFSTYKT